MIDNQLFEFLIYFISGILFSIFFDLFRVLRKSIKTSNIFTYIEDTIFWIIVGSFLIWEIFTISYGELRSYIFIGIIAGIIFYMATISKYFIKVNIKIFNFFKNILKYISKIIKPILKLIKKPIYFTFINLKKISKNIKPIKLNKNLFIKKEKKNKLN